MRLFRHRRWPRALAVWLLLLSAAGVPHLDQGDQACAPVIVDEHDESKHAIRAPVAVEHAHCAICHWTRLPRSAFAPIPSYQSPLSTAFAIEQRDPFIRRAPALDRLPARAPPVRL